MIRTLTIGLLVVLSSLVLTTGVAWSCAVWRPRPSAEPLPSFWTQPDDTTWMGPGDTGLGWSRLTLYGATGFTQAGLEMASPLPDWFTIPPLPEPHDERVVHITTAGWPVRCLRATRLGRGDHSPASGGAFSTGLGPQRIHWHDWRSAFMIDEDPMGLNDDHVLPLAIVPAGLAVNLAFWMLPGLAVVVTFGARRVVRRRRGRCAACGYPRGDSDICTECGQ